MKNFLAIFALGLIAVIATPALAQSKIIYYQDPVFERVSEGDSHPMEEIINLSEKGDVRAQYILGDMYAKGKGGLLRNEKKGQQWFEASAKGGYYPSFIRLAALAKRHKDNVEAYQWYSLCTDHYISSKDQKHCSKSRDKLGLSSDEIKKAKKDAIAWKSERIKEMKQQAEEKKLQDRRDAIAKKNAEKADEKGRKNAKKGAAKSSKADKEEKEPYVKQEIRTND